MAANQGRINPHWNSEIPGRGHAVGVDSLVIGSLLQWQRYTHSAAELGKTG